MVRNFDIAITEDEGLHIMQVTGFRNYDEALQYTRQLYQQKNIVNRLGKSRTIIISEQNLPLLGKQFSYDDYGEFYDKHFAPMKISTEQLLELPVEIGYAEDEEPEVPSEQSDETPTPVGGNENYIPTEVIDIPEDTPKGNNNNEDIIPNNIIEEPTKQVTPVQQDNYVIDEPAPVKPVEDNTIVIDEPTKETPVEDNTIIIDEPTSETPVEDNTIIIDETMVEMFKEHLRLEEKSENTIEKYVRDVRAFCSYVQETSVSKEITIEYKQALLEKGYAVRSINSMIASLNSFFLFIGKTDLIIKTIKEQRQLFCSEDKELSREEYTRLVNAAKSKGNWRLSLIIQTICGTGIRVSELKYITVEAVERGEAVVLCKGKRRSVFIVKALQTKLLRYIKEQKIKTGSVFVTKTGKPINRTNIWRDMKNLCKEAGVNSQKVFPHNLRHLFARVFYGIEKDIAKLADILGHSSINTTRIYIISTGSEHRQRMEGMRLVV